MKKIYMSPEIIIVKVALQKMIAGSPAGKETETTQGFGGDAEDGVGGDSRRFDFWDEEDY